MEKLKSIKNTLEENLHKKNAFNDLLEVAEKKTKISRLNLVLGAVVILILYLIFGYGTSFLATFIGFLYPAYKSIKALETPNKDDDTKWLTYWVVFAAFSVIEAFTDVFFYWIPLYSLLKCAIFVFMMIPTKPNGSILIYEQIIRPYILKHEKSIDSALNKAKDLANDFTEGVKSKAATTVIGEFTSKED